jgi:hypothetical protein
MDLTFVLAWEWFQWIAIRLALFMAVLTLGPSVALIVFDLVLYALRTMYDNLSLRTTRQKIVDVAPPVEEELEEVR